ncbi:MAG: UvrD-helicase domain-containing protein [archaeon]
MGELDYLSVLRAVKEIPFGVGKKLLASFLRGESGDSISRNKLDRLESYGSVAYQPEELRNLIENLIMNRCLECSGTPGNRFLRVLIITPKGESELENPTLHKGRAKMKMPETVITDEDRKAFEGLSFFLSHYNDFQKKAIIGKSRKILCIAGAGTGKTTVLTKRIEFLTKYRTADTKRILAITFTRKARTEMKTRLAGLSIPDVRVETFNSFCEKTLKQHNDIAYDRPVRVIAYSEKIRLIKAALSHINYDMKAATETYFTRGQMRGKSTDQLMHIFVNDCYFVLDYCKCRNLDLKTVYRGGMDKPSVRLVYNVCFYLNKEMLRLGLRDYADQLVDAIKLFKKDHGLVPEYDHILIDEYQDVNSIQIELVNLLNAPNLFAVGDPRQSIYGWRGSDIRYILQFSEDYPGCEIVGLTNNYRSSRAIVALVNSAVKHMGLPDLESLEPGGAGDARLVRFHNEAAEFEFVIQAILASEISRNEIFVLARTNRQLTDLSALFRDRGIDHVVKSEEIHASVDIREGQATLATIHAIKGLEADMVFVVGCNGQNFPCKGSEHPVVEMVKIDEYDKEEEEKRLLYVAMSRAKKTLVMTYTGSITRFITEEMRSMLGHTEPQLKLNKGDSADAFARLREWRLSVSRASGLPPYLIAHDSTLQEIVQKNPLDLTELERIRGLGPLRARKYGEDILRAILGIPP